MKHFLDIQVFFGQVDLIIMIIFLLINKILLKEIFLLQKKVIYFLNLVK